MFCNPDAYQAFGHSADDKTEITSNQTGTNHERKHNEKSLCYRSPRQNHAAAEG